MEKIKIGEKCKTCHKIFNSGIWLSPQFKDEGVLLFCSDKCKSKYIKMKLNRIKWNYPEYYKKLMKLLKDKNLETEDLFKGNL